MESWHRGRCHRGGVVTCTLNAKEEEEEEEEEEGGGGKGLTVGRECSVVVTPHRTSRLSFATLSHLLVVNKTPI